MQLFTRPWPREITLMISRSHGRVKSRVKSKNYILATEIQINDLTRLLFVRMAVGKYSIYTLHEQPSENRFIFVIFCSLSRIIYRDVKPCPCSALPLLLFMKTAAEQSITIDESTLLHGMSVYGLSKLVFGFHSLLLVSWRPIYRWRRWRANRFL